MLWKLRKCGLIASADQALNVSVSHAKSDLYVCVYDEWRCVQYGGAIYSDGADILCGSNCSFVNNTAQVKISK